MRPFRPQYFVRPAKSARPRRVSVQPRRGFFNGSTAAAAASTTDPEIYDLVCVGGGPVGLSLVNALRSHPATSSLRIALIDAGPLSKTSSTFSSALSSSPQSYSNRCSSLTPASYNFISGIGVEDHLHHERVRPYNMMKVWDGVTDQNITFDWSSASGLPTLEPLAPPQASTSSKAIAYMLENNNLVSALLERSLELDSRAHSPLTIFDSTRVDNIALGEDSADGQGPDLRSWPILTLSSGQRLAARLLVGADGANSVVRTFAGIQSRGWDYDRHGVVATLQLSQDHAPGFAATAYQRFLPSGPIAWLPMPGAKATLVWSTHPKWAARLKALSSKDLAAMVNAGFRLGSVDIEYLHGISEGQADEVAWREGHVPARLDLVPPRVESIQAGSVASFPLKFRHADTYVGERVALIGDAAHTMHPLAGQGLNAGLGDAESLAKVVREGYEVGADVGDLLVLEKYNAERYAQNHVLMGAVDKLHKIYSWESGPVVWGRSLGLGLVERWGGLKGLIMGRAESSSS